MTGHFLTTVTLVPFRNVSMTVAPILQYDLALGEYVVGYLSQDRRELKLIHAKSNGQRMQLMMIRDAQRNVGDKVASKQLAIILLTIVQINVEGDRGRCRVLRRMEPRATARWCESVERNNYLGFLVKYSCLSRYSSMMINELIVDIIPFVLNRARVFGQITLNGGINEDVVKKC